MKIALVADANSIHISRWFNWLEEQGHIVKIFSLRETSNSHFFGPEPPLDRTLITNFGSKIRKTTKRLQNLIDDWSAPKPIDAFYKRVFGMTFAEKKAQEEAEYFYYDENGKKKEVRKSTEKTQSIY